MRKMFCATALTSAAIFILAVIIAGFGINKSNAVIIVACVSALVMLWSTAAIEIYDWRYRKDRKITQDYESAYATAYAIGSVSYESIDDLHDSEYCRIVNCKVVACDEAFAQFHVISPIYHGYLLKRVDDDIYFELLNFGPGKVYFRPMIP